jgi:hypothetical protein
MFNSIRAAAGRRLAQALSVGLIAIVCAGQTSAATYEIQIGVRKLFGPGPFPDQQLGTGHVRSMDFRSFMTATVPAFNNGPAEPNVSGEAAQGTPVDGKLSDGTLINENIDMGNAVILNGQFNLLLGAVYGGPSKGDSHFYLDDAYNWTIHDDIAMDPGFPEGIVKIDDFVFSTGPRPVPLSIQTEKHYPGGVDRVGSLQSGDLVVGRLGDDDFDGHVDGVFFAMGQLPLTSPFLPGAPFVQRMEFTSTIPISALDAALLSAATGRNCLRRLVSATAGPRPERDRAELTACVQERERVAVTHMQHVTEKSDTCAPHCAELNKVAQGLADAQHLGVAESSRQAAGQLLDKVVADLAALRPPCAYCR